MMPQEVGEMAKTKNIDKATPGEQPPVSESTLIDPRSYSCSAFDYYATHPAERKKASAWFRRTVANSAAARLPKAVGETAKTKKIDKHTPDGQPSLPDSAQIDSRAYSCSAFDYYATHEAERKKASAWFRRAVKAGGKRKSKKT